MKPVLILAGCLIVSSATIAQDEAQRTKTEEQSIEIQLSPQVPTPKLRMNWSPKGSQLKLREDQEGRLLTSLQLGPQSSPLINLALEKSADSDYFDRLRVDTTGDGLDELDSVFTCEARELRGKVWSSFNFPHTIEFSTGNEGGIVSNPIQLNFWYVVDPTENVESPIIRYNVSGWMQGEAEVAGQTIHVLLFDYSMDGIYSDEDTWSLATDKDKVALYHVGSKRNLVDYNWAGEQAFQVVKTSSDGRSLVVKPYDPGVTREEDERQRDAYARDRTAKRSGRQVTFLHDFNAAKQLAAEKGLPLFLDFETTWCGPCKIMDQWVYTADEVVDASAQWISVKIDGDVSKELVEKYGVSAYPTVVLIKADGTLITKAQGYQSVKEMTELLEKSN